MFVIGWIATFILAVAHAKDRVMDLYRIPVGLSPTHYKLKILTDLADDFSYTGEVWIDVFAKNSLRDVTLNYKNLVIFENETSIEEIPSIIKRDTKSTNLRWLSSRQKKKYRSGKNSDETSTEPTKIEEGTTTTKDDEVIVSTTGESVEANKEDTPPTLTTTLASTSPVEVTTQKEENPPSESATTVLPSSENPAVSESTTTTTTTTTENVPSSTAKPQDMPTLKISNHDYDTERQFLTLETNRELEAGKAYRVYVKFQGFLSDNLVGFYRVAYGKRNKRTSWLAATVFEPMEARSAFPCFDEPEYKATFDVILGHSSEYNALSNMPLKHTDLVEKKPGWQWDYFQTTPPMSTYLVAFIISDLESLDTKEVARNATQFKFWARHDVVHKARYASKVVPNMKQYLEKIIQVPDVMPKYDFVAVPNFISNALENWGLLSLSEKGMLFNPGYTSILNKYETTRLLAHELSHSWFGNSLTPRWWDEIWLSEGLCNFFETKASDHVQPQWDVITFSTVSSYLRVFSLDALQSTHPLVFEVNNLNDINEIFDSITYQKGYYLMRMLNHTFGEEAFLKGVSTYVRNNKLGVIEGHDLWKPLNDAGHESGHLPADMNLNDVMDSWTKEPGYPVVEVERNYANRSATLTQKRFIRPKYDYEFRSPNGTADARWYIPVTYTTKDEMRFSDTKPRLWLTPQQDSYEIQNITDDQNFVLVNVQAAGLYRVNYDYDNWALLVDHLLSDNYTDIAVINRVQIIDDLLSFARAGEISYQQALDATSYLRQEENYLPWKAALSNFEYISRMLRATETSRVFKKFMRNLVSARYDELGFEPKKNETLFESMNRKQIVKWACRTGHRTCTRKSVNLFKKWTEEKKPDENNPVPSNLRSVVYCTAIEQGGARDWQFLWQRYASNTAVTDKAAILAGLGCSRNVRTLRKYLDWSLKESSGLKKQDGVAVFKSVSSNDVGFPLAKKFLKERLNDVSRYVGSGSHHLPQMVDAIAKKMNQMKDLEDLESMEKEHESTLRAVPRAVRQAMEKVKFNVGWVQKNFSPITEWLKRQTNSLTLTAI